MAEIIDISDDEVLIEESPKKGVTPASPAIANKRPFRCLNSDCRSEEKLIKAEEYVRRYFGVLPYPKKRRVCETCHTEAELQQESLVNCITSGRLLLAEKIPPPKTTVVLTDSDSDPSDASASEAESDYVYEEDDLTLEKEILALTKELGLDRQIKEGVKHLEDTLLKIQGSFNVLESDYSKTETSLDSVRKDFYNTFRFDIMWQPPLDIGPSSVPFPPEGSGEVIAEPSVVVPNANLPPVGPLQRWELAPNEMVYSMKYSLYARWVQAQVIEVERREPKDTIYRIRYNRNAKSAGLSKVMPGRQLAYFESCATRIPVGTRIIAKYKDDDPKNTTISGSFYVGIVAEIPTAANKYRYLIFFDDGYAQYVNHQDIRVVTEASACSWEDVSSDSREFIKEYLQMYPERPMVRLQKWNYVKTEWNGRWWRAQVKEVDGSLVKMFFPPLEGRCEWIYRGSTRLSPLFHKKMNIQQQAEQPLRTIRRRTAALPSRAVVEYGTFGQGQDMDSGLVPPTTEVSGQPRSVARKSTSRPSRPTTPPKEILIKVEQESKGFTNQHSFPEKAVKFTSHLCTSQCLGAGDSMKKYKGLSPLLQPLLFGWRRQFVKICRKTVNRYEIYYSAPCGRRLGTIEDVFKYLLMTESNLEIDCFSFELSVMVTHEWEPFKKIVDIEDFSKGEEDVPISCVNSLEEVMPQELRYSIVRIPSEYVPLDLNPDFLVCCDCTDDCRDKSKCACWQLTISNTRILERQENQSAGYTYRRLFEQVQSGIYECNTKCKCSNHCLNKVVQHPLRLKLQLFKTARRGWGVRTLHDMPRGGFVCVYVGHMLNEAKANEEGKIVGGDDYYAELDYIEVMERAKEGYEDEAITIEEDTTYQPDTQDHGEVTRTPRASDSNDSDGFYSDNDGDNTKEDTDFSHPSYMKKGGLGKREKSARLQERAARRSRSTSQQRKEESSRSNSDDDVAKAKAKNKKKEGEEDGDSKEKDSEKEEGKKDNEDEEDAEEEDDEDDVKQRQPQPFVPRQLMEANISPQKPLKSIRDYYGMDEAVYIMDAKRAGNIGRFLNHSCEPNVFVQNVFVDTHDLRFPWIAFFAINNIKAGTELTWDYSYDVGSVPGKIKYCYCGARKCRGRLL